jgi:hypothetical protein
MGPFESAVGMQRHGAGMAHRVRVGLHQHVDVVTGGHQLVDQIGRKPRFNAQAGARRSPGSPQEPARTIQRLLERLAVADMAGEHLGLGLRLAVAAHRAVSQDAPVLEDGERRV